MMNSKDNEQLLQSNINQLLVSFKSGNLDITKNLAISITKQFPNHNLSWKVLASIYSKTGQIDEALISIQKSVRISPKDAEAHSNMGLILFKLNDLEKAKRSYKKAIELKADYAEVYNNLGMTLQKLNKLEQAEFNYKKAIELKPNFEAAYNNLGNILKELDKLEEAEVCYEKAIALNSNFVEALYNLGITLLKLGKLVGAESSFKKTIELKPDHFEVYNNLGITLQSLGKLEEAEFNYTKAIELKPKFAVAYNNLGNTMKDLNKLDQAAVYYKKGIELRPDYAEAYNNLGITLQRLDKLNEAEFNYKKAIELNPNYAEAYNNLGNTVNDLGRSTEAEFNYKKAIELKLEYPEAHKNLDTLLRQDKLFKMIQIKKLENEKKKQNLTYGVGLTSDLFISNRNVETELLSSLYKISSTELSKTEGGPLFGIGRTTDYQLFENNFSILDNVKKELINIMEKAVKADIYIMESFFNILKAGAGSIPHTHVSSFDKIKGLIKKKFSLVYYVSVGDQNCINPGFLELYDPDKKILPTNGMIMIFPAGRKHSAVYDGRVDRVMIGVNFYSLI